MPEIRKIKRKDLEIEKYSKAIEKSLNYRIYAEYWYLDVLTNEKWECWIWGDYEVVMPVPLQFKFGLKFVLQPIYCQQLGVFYEKEISDELFKEFEKKLHSYRVRAYHFNEENTERYEPEGERRVNYVLDLSRSYEEIKSSYSKGIKWNLKQFEKSEESILESKKTEEIVDFKSRTSTNSFSKNSLEKMFQSAESKCSLSFKVCFREDKLEAFGAFLSSINRIIYINSSASLQGKKIGAPTGILNQVIQENANRSLKFDFEGSNLAPLAKFFKGFGAEVKEYTHFHNSK